MSSFNACYIVTKAKIATMGDLTNGGWVVGICRLVTSLYEGDRIHSIVYCLLSLAIILFILHHSSWKSARIKERYFSHFIYHYYYYYYYYYQLTTVTMKAPKCNGMHQLHMLLILVPV